MHCLSKSNGCYVLRKYLKRRSYVPPYNVGHLKPETVGGAHSFAMVREQWGEPGDMEPRLMRMCWCVHVRACVVVVFCVDVRV